MATSVRVIFAAVCLAAVCQLGTACAPKNSRDCGQVSWGQMNDNIRVHRTTIAAGDTKAMIDLNDFQDYDCRLVGALAIACDNSDSPRVKHRYGNYVLVQRKNAKETARLVIIKFCEITYKNMPGVGVPYSATVKQDLAQLVDSSNVAPQNEMPALSFE